MKTTIVDVAKACNVSVATVSRVINGNYPVKEETKEKVLKVIEELQYKPNTQARDLIKKQSSTIGVVVPSISNMFFTNVINGIESYFEKSEYSIFLCTTEHDKDKEISRINELISRNVAGIIVVDPNDQENGAMLAINYLLSKNHKNIAFIRGDNSYSYDIKEKVYKEMMKDINNFKEEFIVNIGHGNSIQTVNKTMKEGIKLLSLNKDVTGVFACNDLMAIGIMNACKKLNIKIPNDLSIVGYDNIELSEMVEPKLTTIDQNMFLLGKNSAILLNEKIENNNKYSKSIVLNNHLIKRDT